MPAVIDRPDDDLPRIPCPLMDDLASAQSRRAALQQLEMALTLEAPQPLPVIITEAS